MKQNPAAIIALITFLVTYGLILFEKPHRTVAALTGAGFIIFLGIISQEDAIKAIDFNTIGLLIGMMIIVGLTRRTGIFEFIAIKVAKLVKGDPWLIMLGLALITATASALLDNVTTVLLVVPVTFSLTTALELDPLPYLLTLILASNIGGTATLIGDPPNIMIGSATGLSFTDFIHNLALPVVVTFIVTMGILKLIYHKTLTVSNAVKLRIMELDESNLIKDYSLLKKSISVLSLTIIGFVLHKFLHLESATIALGGAVLLLLASKEEPEDILLSIEWPTIFFFAGLFVLVGALEHTGIIAWAATAALKATGGAVAPTTFLILWVAAIASSFIDNIPFVATMVPLIKQIGEVGGVQDLAPFWWALSLGSCLGGNGTLIGASANVIVAGLAEKQGNIISFKGFMKIAFPLMLLSIVISTVYLYLAYLR